MYARYRLAWLALALLTVAPAARAAQYAGGSLIIPMQASYQDYCGTASAYGLVYNVLRANDGLTALGKTRITVHWAYNATKGSPNRCVPTNVQNPPIYGSYSAANKPPWNDPIWNDGCDFRVVDSSAVPVKLVNNTTGAPASDTLITTIDTSTDTSVYPGYTSVQVQQTTNPKITSVGYMGGPFIIAASDANLFLQLLSGTLVVKDSAGNNIDFAPFRTVTSPQCSGAFAFGGATPSHNVRIHRAQVAFTADDNTSFNAPPPRVALLETWAAAAAGGGAGGGGGGGGGGSGAVSGGILDQYLLNAGLKFTGAFGCPPGGANQATAALKAKYCPTGATGQIFDYFDVADLANGLIFATDAAGKPLYQALWTPHWDVNMTTLTTPTNKAFTQAATGTLLAGTYYYRVSAINTMGETLASPETSLTVSALKGVVVNWNAVTGASGYKVYGRTKAAEKYIATVLPPSQGAAVPTTYTDDGSIVPNGALPISNTTLSPPADVIASLSNISAFLNAKTGLFAECASIETYEGESVNQLAAPITTGSQFQTCVKDSVNPGACSATATTPFGVTRNNPSAPFLAYVQNCTDPTAASSSNCIYFPNAGDPFMQFGDYRWFNQFGLVQNYIPATGSIYKPGTVSLGFNVASLDKTKLSSAATARTMANSDEATRSLKDANPNLANILYLAGHTYDGYVAGTRIVLGTLFQLGLVYASTETGYVGPTLFNDSVFVPTYDRITSAPTSSAVKKFDWNAGSQFLFPYHSGHLKTHSLSSGLVQGNNDFAASVQWDAKTAMPKPDKRNVFTYLGGTLTTAATGLARQTGWAPVDFDYTSIQSPATTCVDKWSVGQVAANGTTGKPGPYTGMNAGSNGVCDLEEVLAANLVMGASDFGSDNGASEQAAIKTKLLDTSVGGAVQVTQQLTQMIRGFCFSTAGGKDGWGAMQANPSTTQCNFNRGADLNTVGGFVHSQVAVVPPSGNIADLPNGKHRPTVAYAGGLDGQLHAFYVPPPTGPSYDDSGYQGPANATGLPFTSAKGVFHTNWLSTGSFTPPAALTELWAFIPPGQIPYLYSNSAMVDSSPAVIDVFGDLDGDGIREWHTVLIASAGGTNRELFALDVTNPLAPVMLWDIESTFDNVSLTYAPVPLMDDNTGQGLVVTEQAFRWRNHCRAADVSAGICTATTFQLPPASDAGRTQSGRFNYLRLGASQSVQAALMRRNNDPVFAAFIATNEPGGNGMNLFALDISTGRKLWEFDNPYDKTTDAASSDHPKMADALDNTPPQGATLFSKAGTSLIDTVYVGDLEGSLWEIDAADGLNLASYASKLGGSTCAGDGWCNFALSNAFWYDTNAYPQPITTLSTIFAVPVGLPSTSPFVNYQGQPMLTYGTAGTDAVSSLSYTVTGSVHLFPLTYSGRLQASDILGPPVQTSVARTKGLAKELAGYPQYVATGERLYGSIVAAGDHLYFATTKGTVTNIDSRGSLSGSTYAIDLGAAAGSNRSTLTSTAGGAGGTPLVGKTTSGQIRVVTVTDQTINVSAAQTVALQAPSINGVGQTPTAFLGWFFKAMGHEY